MNEDFTRDVNHALDYLRRHWGNRNNPSPNALSRAKRLINAGTWLREPADAELQEKFDQLHGLFM